MDAAKDLNISVVLVPFGVLLMVFCHSCLWDDCTCLLCLWAAAFSSAAAVFTAAVVSTAIVGAMFTKPTMHVHARWCC